MNSNERQERLTDDDQRKLRALLYTLTPIEMLKVVMEVIERQRLNNNETRSTSVIRRLST